MANKSVSLPVPSANATGAAVPTDQLGAAKTLLFAPSGFVGIVNVEASMDGVTYGPVCSFQGGTSINVNVVAAFMRVRVSGYKAGSAVLTVGAEGTLNNGFVSLPAPAGAGLAGAAVAVDGFGDFWTAVVPGGSFNGAIIVEASQNGVDYAQVLKSFNQGGLDSGRVSARWARVRSVGSAVAGAELGVGSETPSESFPPQPAFVGEEEVFIYARTTGSDSNGNGSLANPYRTFARAIRDVPSIIPPGKIYRVDITGLGTETLEANYILPQFTGPEAIGSFDFSQEWFHYYGLVNIQADPTILETFDGTAGETWAADPDTNLIALTVPGAGWVPGEHIGKFLCKRFGASRNSVVWDNTADTLFLTRAGDFTEANGTPIAFPTFPVVLAEPSAHLTAPFVAQPAVHETAFNVNSSTVNLLGLRIDSEGNPSGTFGCSFYGDGPPPAAQLCQLPRAQFATTEWTRVRACWLPNHFAFMAPTLMISSFVDGVNDFISPGVGFVIWGARGMDSIIVDTVLEGVTPIRYTDLIEEFRAASLGSMVMRRSLIESPIADPVTAMNHGIVWQGAALTLNQVQINNALGDGVRVQNGPGAWVVVHGLTGTGNGGFGLNLQDGALANVTDQPTRPHDRNTATPTSITGAGGDLKVGDLAAVTWVGLPAPFSVTDPFAGVNPNSTGTNSRCYGEVG